MLKVMKGYKILRNNNQIDMLLKISSELSLTSITSNKNSFMKGVFIGEYIEPELVLRQFLLANLVNTKLNQSILYSIGNSYSSISYPLPKSWRPVLRKYGLKVSETASAKSFFLFTLKRIIYGVLLAGLKIFRGLKNMILFKSKHIENYIFFESISPSNLPDGTSFSYDIMTWYESRFEGKKDVEYFYHSLKNARDSRNINNKQVRFIESPFPGLYSFKKVLKFIWWSFSTIIFSTLGFIRGRWWNGLMLSEGVKAKLIQLSESKYLAKEYLFNISGVVYRPLWTYAASEKGSLVTLYFYSSNCEIFQQNGTPPEIFFQYRIMSWPRYLVWDQQQNDFVRRAVGSNSQIEVVGPIWFSSSNQKLPVFPSMSVVVFDVQPVRDLFYQSLAPHFDYYIPEICNQFLIDIKELCDKLNVTIVHKRKRQIGKLAHYKYRNLISKFSRCDNYIPIDSNIAPQRIIESCKAVISMPFTSTALISKNMNVPAIYYDPSGRVECDDKAAHGIEIVSGKVALEKWMIQNFIA
jgi:polysaccharide biosynthesis PFTS motif protein